MYFALRMLYYIMNIKDAYRHSCDISWRAQVEWVVFMYIDIKSQLSWWKQNFKFLELFESTNVSIVYNWKQLVYSNGEHRTGILWIGN